MAGYFLKYQIPEIVNPNHTFGNEQVTPRFYKITIEQFNRNKDIFYTSSEKSLYKNLIENKLTPLTDQVKRINDQVNIRDIFNDLHNNTFTTATQKQITYRMLYGITPTSEELAKSHKRVFEC